MNNEIVTKGRTDMRRYICSYGNRHGLNDECGCRKIYKVWPVKFRQRSYEMFPNVRYFQDLTGSQRQEIINSFD